MDVLLSDKAFIGIVLSAIEAFKKECTGALLGYNLRDNRIVVEYSFPYQLAERSYSQVIILTKRESRVKEILPKITQLNYVGEYHSHTQRGGKKATAKLSDEDEEAIEKCMIEIVVAVNEAKRKTVWSQDRKGMMLLGTIGDYHLTLACYYKKKDGTIIQCPLLCPYILGFDLTF